MWFPYPCGLSGNTFVLLPFGFSNPSLSLVLTTFLRITLPAVRSLLSGFFSVSVFLHLYLHVSDLVLFPRPTFSFPTSPMPPRRRATNGDSGSPAKSSNTNVAGAVKPVRSTRKKYDFAALLLLLYFVLVFIIFAGRCRLRRPHLSTMGSSLLICEPVEFICAHNTNLFHVERPCHRHAQSRPVKSAYLVVSINLRVSSI